MYRGMKNIARSLVLMLFSISFSSYALAEYDLSYSQGGPPSSGPAIGTTEYHLIVSPTDAENTDTHSNSKAYQMITYLFGTMSASQKGGIICITSSNQPCSNIPGQLFAIFNTGLLVIAMLSLSYVIAQTVTIDASQGLAAGQKYSHEIIPLRSILGIVFLIPNQMGYGLAQIIIVRIILLGSSAATGVWQYLLTYYHATGEPIGSAGLMYSGTDTVQTSNAIAETFVQNMAKLAVCNAYVNTPSGRAAQFPSNPPPPNTVFTTQFYTGDGSSYTIQTGVQNAPSDEPYAMSECYCGGIPLGILETGQEAVLQNYTSQISGLSEEFVIEFMQNSGSMSSSAISYYESQYSVIMNMLKTDLLLNAYQNSKNSSQQSSSEQTEAQSEWFDAPAYFFKMLSSGSTSFDVSLNQSLSPSPPGLPTDADLALATDFSQNAQESDDINMKITFVANSAATADFQHYLRQMFHATDSQQDALLGLAAVGQSFLNLALQLMIASFALTTVIIIATNIMSDYLNMSSFGIITSFMTLIVTIFQAIGLIIPVASIFAIALPMTPLIIYTSAIISWIFGSIIAVVGAPILCLGLISHSPGMGKSAPALMIIINAFIRPSLNVIGLVAGAKLFNIFYFLFTQSFLNTVNATMKVMGVNDSALMSIMSIIFLYVYTYFIAAGCTRCYSLIYLLPDRVLTWVSAAPMAMSESGHGMQSIQQSQRKASQSLKKQYDEVSKTGSRLFDEEIQKALSKYHSQSYKGPRNLSADVKSTVQNISNKMSDAFESVRNLTPWKNQANLPREAIGNEYLDHTLADDLREVREQAAGITAEELASRQSIRQTQEQRQAEVDEEERDLI